MIKQEHGRLIYHYDAEELWIEPWGKNAVRVRATKNAQMPLDDWALLPKSENDLEEGEKEIRIRVTEAGGELINGKLKVFLTQGGKITIQNQNGKVLLEEYWRNRRDVTDSKCSAIEVEAREFRPCNRFVHVSSFIPGDN